MNLNDFKLKNHDYYFIHIPKNAGTAFTSQLCNGIGGHYRILDYPQSYWNKTIAIIRNPFDRLISFYNYVRMEKNYWHSNDNTTQYKEHILHKYCLNNTFKTFITDLCKHNLFKDQIHLYPQVYWLKLYNTPEIFTHILSFDNLNEDLSNLLGENIQLKNVNKSTLSNVDTTFDDEMKKMVYEKYIDDFNICKIYNINTNI